MPDDLISLGDFVLPLQSDTMKNLKLSSLNQQQKKKNVSYIIYQECR